MPKYLNLLMLACIPFAACADGGRSLVVAEGPAAPINAPDSHLIDPTGSPVGPESSQSELPVGNGSGSTGAGSQGAAGSGSGSNSASNGQGSGNGTHGGSESGSPVPEPGTLLLFGSGLAGLAGFSLRRRRREPA